MTKATTFLRKLLLILLLLAATLEAAAQAVTFRADAPTQVAAGEMFRVEFTLDAAPDTPEKLAQAPDFGDLELLAGPSLSQGANTRIIDGQVEQSIFFTYTYVLRARAEGRFTISPAATLSGSKRYTTKPLVIEVMAAGSADTPAQGPDAGALASDDVLLVASAGEREVYKGQPVRLTLKLYTRVGLSGVQGVRLPSFNGFWNQEIPLDARRQWQRETFGGKAYNTQVLGQYLLYPQQAGTLAIDPFHLTAVAQLVEQAPAGSSPLDEIFGGGARVREVARELQTAPIAIAVRELPAGAPASFNGAVGQFTLQADVSSRAIAANTSATYTLRIAGVGNLPLVQAPRLELPASFEQFSVKTTEELRGSAAGTSGYRQFDYPFIARAEGAYTLPQTAFTYFNPATARYVTLTAPEIPLDITPGQSGASGGMVGLTREEIAVLGSDIRFIKTGAAGLREVGGSWVGGAWFWLILLALAGGAAGAYYLLKSHFERLGNASLMRGKRANRVALGRLREAERHKRSGDRRAFLEEMLRALWGYQGDKLNIPVADLTKDNVREGLTRRGVPPALAERYIEVISACEMAQYSPESSSRSEELYRSGVEAISAMEQVLK